MFTVYQHFCDPSGRDDTIIEPANVVGSVQDNDEFQDDEDEFQQEEEDEDMSGSEEDDD